MVRVYKYLQLHIIKYSNDNDLQFTFWAYMPDTNFDDILLSNGVGLCVDLFIHKYIQYVTEP